MVTLAAESTLDDLREGYLFDLIISEFVTTPLLTIESLD